MSSNDIRIVIDGNEFVVDGEVLKPAPVNNFQQEILKRLDGIESRLDGVETRLGVVETEQKAIRSEVITLAHQQELTAQKLDMSLWFIGICFALLAVLVTYIGIFAPKFWERVTHKESHVSENNLDEIASRVAEILRRQSPIAPNIKSPH